MSPQNTETFNVNLQNISITTPNGVKIIDNLCGNASKGDVLSIIGDEGVGKTCLLKAISNMLPASFIITGNIKVNKPAYLSQYIENYWQNENPFHYLFKKTQNEIFDESNWNRYSEVLGLFDKMKLNPDVFFSDDKTISTLSGGEIKKLQIVKTLLQGAEVLLLDEPTNHLDLETIKWLETFLKNYKGTTILVSHDEKFLENVSTSILYMQRGKTLKPIYRFSGHTYKEFLSEFKNEIEHVQKNIEMFDKERAKQKKELAEKITNYQSRLKKAAPQDSREKGRILRGQKKGMQQITHDKRQILDIADKPENLEADERIRLTISDDSKIENGKTVLDLNLSELKIFDRVLAKNLKLHIQGPEKIVIIGNNGIGKSTFLKYLIEYCKSTNDKSITIGYLPQNYQETLEQSSLTPTAYLKDVCDDVTTIKTMLSRINIKRDDMEKEISKLSGGQKCKILLTKFLLEKVNFLFLDEPTNNLYPLSNMEFRKFLNNFPGSAIIISHDRLLIEEVATRIYKFTENGLIDVTQIKCS